MARLIIRHYHSGTTESDIRGLFGKIGNVEEVYMPSATITGIVRNFAIVKVNCSEDSLQKALKALNGSNWNGSRINIEIAKEYYKDRLENERKILAEKDCVEPVRASIEYAAWKSPFISLRIKSNAPCVKISTIPGSSTEKGVIPCGLRGFDIKLSKYQASSKASESKLSVPAPVESSVAKPLQVANASSSKPLDGGGLRKGFGNIAIPSSVTVSTTVKPTRDSTVDCCIDEHDNSTDDLDMIDRKYLEDEFSEPCITETDLTEEVLTAERLRASRIIDMLLSGNDKISSEPVVASAPAVTSASVSKANDGWNSAVIKRFDPLKMASSGVDVGKATDENAKSAVNSQSTANQSNFAEINVLKDIFYKEVIVFNLAFSDNICLGWSWVE